MSTTATENFLLKSLNGMLIASVNNILQKSPYEGFKCNTYAGQYHLHQSCAGSQPDWIQLWKCSVRTSSNAYAARAFSDIKHNDESCTSVNKSKST
jgi:hypothetical protein